MQFEEELQRVTDIRSSIGTVAPSIVETDNDVVLEDELIEMADTQMRVQLVTRSLRHHFDLLRAGITSTNT